MTVKYDPIHDAWYDSTTNQWLETTCTDPQCDFCAHRPKFPTDSVATHEDQLADHEQQQEWLKNIRKTEY